MGVGKGLSPSEVRAARLKARGFTDPIALNDEMKSIFFNGDQKEEIEARVEDIKKLISSNAKFFKLYNYKWAVEVTSYDTAIEVTLQYRMLRALVLLFESHSSGTSDENSLFENIVVLYGSTVNYAYSGPRFKVVGEINFIQISFGFIEISLLLARSIHASKCRDSTAFLGPIDSSWYVFFSNTNGSIHFAKPFIVLLITRLISSEFDGHDVHLPEISKKICSLKTFSPGTSDFLRKSSNAFESDLLYILIEFLMFHEASHAIHKDFGEGRTLERESLADDKALNLFATSWGWRDSILNRTGLDAVGKIVLGPLITLKMLTLWHQINAVLFKHIVKCESIQKFVTAINAHERAIEELKRRDVILSARVYNLIGYYACKGEKIDELSFKKVQNLDQIFEDFLELFQTVSLGISCHDYLRSVNIAKSFVDE